jgi:hypothetical protein
VARLREYSSAGDLIEASTRGQTTTAASTQRIAMLRKTSATMQGDTAHRRGVAVLVLELLAIENNADGCKLLALGSEFVVDSRLWQPGAESSRG